MKFHRFLAPAALLLALGGARSACAQIAAPYPRVFAAPYPRVFAGERGQTLLKVVPDKHSMTGATATLTRFNTDGTEEVLWNKPLVNLPGGVLLSNDYNPYLVTTDSWGNAGGAHALVIYNPKGEVVADLKGDDFLPPVVKPPHKAGEPFTIVMDGGGRQWTNNAELSFEPRFDPTTLVVQLFHGKPIPVALQNGNTKSVGDLRQRGNQIRVDIKTGAITQVTPEQLDEEEMTSHITHWFSVVPVGFK